MQKETGRETGRFLFFGFFLNFQGNPIILPAEQQARNMYSSTTSNVTVEVEPQYLASESVPEKNIYVWAYHVRIENNGTQTLQLRTRHWKITDAYGRTQEVRGPGVVGEQPVLKPGQSFEYTSGTPLSTPSGIMAGSYAMEGENGDVFDVAIPAFSLDSPDTPRQVN
jgi:ApaG protein